MALEPDPDPLARALEAARAETVDDDWAALSSTIKQRLRRIVVPATPLLVHDDQGRAQLDDHGSRVLISTRVVATALREALRGPTYAVATIDLDHERTLVGEEPVRRLDRVRLGLVAAYGTDLRALGDLVRAQVELQLVDLLGPDARTISVEVVDVVDGDPRQV